MAGVKFIRNAAPLLKKIPYWITREDYHTPKPSPKSYFKAIRALKGGSGTMVGFEDTLKRVRALKRASITPVLICATNHPQFAEIPQNFCRVYPSFNDMF